MDGAGLWGLVRITTFTENKLQSYIIYLDHSIHVKRDHVGRADALEGTGDIVYSHTAV